MGFISQEIKTLIQNSARGEILSARTARSKLLDQGNGKKTLIAVRYPIHYDDNGSFKEPDERISAGGAFKSLSYTAQLASSGAGVTIINRENRDDITIELDSIPGHTIQTPTITRNDLSVILHDIATDTDIEIEFRPNRVIFWKILKSSSAPTVFRFKLTAPKNTDWSAFPEVRGTDSTNKFLEATRTEISSKDVNINSKVYTEKVFEEKFLGRLKLRDGKTRVITFSTNITYPVKFDVNVTKDVPSDADDGYARNTATFRTAPNFNTAHRIYNYTAGGGDYSKFFCRFTGITIPQSSTIDDATLTVGMKSHPFPYSVVTRKVYWHAIDSNNPAAPTNNAGVFTTNITAKQQDTITGLNYTIANKDADVKDVIQELVNSFDYDNEAMVLLLEGHTYTTAEGSKGFRVYDYNTGTSKDARLVINYTEVGGAGAIMTPRSGYWGDI